MKTKQLLVVLLGIAVVLSGCSSSSANHDKKLTVFAAASLKESFTDMKKAFEDRTGADVTLNFAGTQTLRTQLEQGAPADVFASANTSHMKDVKKEGLVGDYETLAYNKLILIVPKDNPADLHHFKDLADKNLQLVIGVEDVPVGMYTRKAFGRANKVYGANFKEKALSHVASNETNVKKVSEKVEMGEADAGITYATDLTPSVEGKVKEIEIPKKINVTATDTIAAVKDSNHSKLAKQWVQFVLSNQGQKILAKHHLIKRDKE